MLRGIERKKQTHGRRVRLIDMELKLDIASHLGWPGLKIRDS